MKLLGHAMISKNGGIQPQADLLSPSSLLGGASSDIGGPSGVGPSSMTSSIEGEDGVAEKVGGRAKDDAEVMMELPSSDSRWLALTDRPLNHSANDRGWSRLGCSGLI